MSELLENIKSSSNIPINETDSGDISNTQKMLSKLIDSKYNTSLLYNISEVLPTSSSFSSVFTSTRDVDGNIKVSRSDIYTKSRVISTGYTREVWDDMNAMYGKKSIDSSSEILGGISAQNENKELIEFLHDKSELKGALGIDSSNTGWITSSISQRVAESVIEMNRYSFKTYDSFCILSSKWSSAFLGTATYVKSDSDSKETSTLFVGRYGKTDYYINPVPNTSSQFTEDYDYSYEIQGTNIPDYCYVGLKSSKTMESSLIFTPYQYDIQDVIDPETGNTTLFLYNRYGLEVNPLHEPTKQRSMLHKFEINEI